jgi:rubredoxin
MNPITVLFALFLIAQSQAFAPMNMPSSRATYGRNAMTSFRMSEEPAEAIAEAPADEPEEELDAGTKLALEKQRRADELRSQEVFMKRSTGIHKCGNCDWEYDEKKGDSFMIGGMIKPDTPYSELPSNWRCPTCRASKDNFFEVTEEIPGFEVNQGYGLGGNSMTSGQKSGIVFGGLAVFFLLFLGGYGLS